MSDGGRGELLAIFHAALHAVDAERAVRDAVERRGASLAIGSRPIPDGARLVVAAAGKAAAAMAAGLERAAGPRVAGGLVVTKDGHELAPPAVAGWRVRCAGHPIPDARGEEAARELLALAAATRPPDVFVVLLSGGASALLTCPRPGLSLADLAATTRALIASGAEIAELNAVRKHLVEVAGGRLACAAGAARIEVLVVSDVLGNRLDVIGSGPCAPDPTTFADALAAIDRRGLRAELPARVRAELEAGARGERSESPKPGDPVFERVRTTVVASLGDALAAARAEAAARGLRPIAVSQALRGEAREVGRRVAALARAVRRERPACLIAGGETTVTFERAGRGGRNQELALAAAIALEGTAGAALLAAGTDGSDGPTDAAGAFADGGTAARARAVGLDPQAALAAHASYDFFAAEGGLLRTGPTRTNVTDLLLLRLEPEPPGPVTRANALFPKASESV